MPLTILGAVPYAAMGVLMAHMGYNWQTWQLWAMLGLMTVSDAISYIKYRL